MKGARRRRTLAACRHPPPFLAAGSSLPQLLQLDLLLARSGYTERHGVPAVSHRHGTSAAGVVCRSHVGGLELTPPSTPLTASGRARRRRWPARPSSGPRAT